MAARPRHTPETWATVRAQREAGDSLEALAKRHGIALSSIHERARAEGWTVPPRRKPVPPPRKPKPPQTEAPKPKDEAEAAKPKVAGPPPGDTSPRTAIVRPARTLPPIAQWQWKPGQSGNPAGVPAESARAKRMYQRLTVLAAQRAEQMLMSGDPQMVAIAMREVNGVGLPKKDPPPAKAPPPLDFSTMTLEQMDALDVALTALAEAQRLEEVRRRNLGLPPEAEEPIDGEVMAPEEPPADVPTLRDDGAPPVIEAECVDLDLTAW